MLQQGAIYVSCKSRCSSSVVGVLPDCLPLLQRRYGAVAFCKTNGYLSPPAAPAWPWHENLVEQYGWEEEVMSVVSFAVCFLQVNRLGELTHGVVFT